MSLMLIAFLSSSLRMQTSVGTQVRGAADTPSKLVVQTRGCVGMLCRHGRADGVSPTQHLEEASGSVASTSPPQ